ncbi:hypothetical protein EO238_24535, partial [Citrobacter sp. AAK_AS5]
VLAAGGYIMNEDMFAHELAWMPRDLIRQGSPGDDGAGILLQIPHELFAEEAARLGFTLPKPQQYGVAQLFMPRAPINRQDIERIWWETTREEGLKVLGWRDVPTNTHGL